MIPSRYLMWAGLVSSAAQYAHAMDPWVTEYGFDFSGARARTANQWHECWFSDADLLAPPVLCAELDFASLDTANIGGEMRWTVEQHGVAHGLAVWFDGEMSPGVGYSNSPASGTRHMPGQGFLPFPAPLVLSPGDAVSVTLRAHFVVKDYVWRWDTRCVDGVTGRVKVEHRQSTWLSQPLSVDGLRRRHEAFVPELTDAARIDRSILELMEQRLPLRSIAERIAGQFPSAFENADAALARVGSLSERYSR
jgi:protein arginine N-methyltransferase 1